MTEEDAKTKWCPFARSPLMNGNSVHMGPYSVNRAASWNEPGPVNSYCIASACMAWRWVEQIHSRDVELWSKSKNKRVTSAFSDDAEWRPVKGKIDDEPPPATGFCGLAGKP